MYVQQIFYNLNLHESRKMSIFLKKVLCESLKLNTFSSKEIWKQCQFSKKSIFLAEGPHNLSFRTERRRRKRAVKKMFRPSLLISPDDPLWARPADGRLWPTNNDDDHNQYQHQEQDQKDDGEYH